jgi:uncharacterized membrane protein
MALPISCGAIELLELLLTFAAAMTPIGELRLAIPLGISKGVPWALALPIAMIGNMVPVLLLIPGLDRLSRFLLSFPNPIGRVLTWRVERLRQTHTSRFQRYGAVALVVLVAIPLPMTGAWTGSLAAWIFRVPARQAIPLIAMGVVIAGLIVTALTVSGGKLAELLLAD